MQENIQINPRDFVVVRIWMSKFRGTETGLLDVVNQLRNPQNADECSVGHASLQVIKNAGENSRYASYWPTRTPQVDEIVPGEFHSLSRDISEMGNPDRTYVFFSLDNQALWDAMSEQQIRERFPYYTLIDGKGLQKKVQKKVTLWGGTASKPDDEITQSGIPPVSCSAVVYNLLNQNGYNGKGLRYLGVSLDFTRDLVVTTPNNLAEMCREGERNERGKWTETSQHKKDVAKVLANTLLSIENLQVLNAAYQTMEDLLDLDIQRQRVYAHKQSLEGKGINISERESEKPSHQMPRVIVPQNLGPVLTFWETIRKNPVPASVAGGATLLLLARNIDVSNLNTYIGAVLLLALAYFVKKMLDESQNNPSAARPGNR